MFAVKWEVQGFVPIGMMEYWNIAKTGLGILKNLANEPIRLSDKTYNKSRPFGDPRFHRSIIPIFHLTILEGELIVCQVERYKAAVLQFTE